MTTLIFDALSSGGTIRNFSIPIINDNTLEGTETFGLTASIANNRGNFSAGGNVAIGQIFDAGGGKL